MNLISNAPVGPVHLDNAQLGVLPTLYHPLTYMDVLVMLASLMILALFLLIIIIL